MPWRFFKSAFARRRAFAERACETVKRACQLKGIDKSTGEVLVEVDPRYFRPTEVDSLLGDPSKARAKLGWRHKTSFDTLVADMVDADRVTVRDERERRDRRG